MVKKITLATVAFLLMAVSALPAAAQDILAGNGYSPYSLFGFGDPVRQGNAYNQSMGGIGIGDRNVRYINLLNPAAITAREVKSFMMDFGLENRNTLYEGNAAASMAQSAKGELRSASNTFNMHHIAATLPIGTIGAFKLAVMPYSTVSYDFQADETSDELIVEAGDIRYSKKGRGGVYQAVLGTGFTLWRRLSLGADLDYYFGKIDRYSSATFTTKSSYRTINSGWAENISCFGGKLGIQYTQPITNALSAVAGATYGFSSRLKGGQIRYAFGETSSSKDTVIYNRSSLENYRVPSEIGAGISLRYADVWMAGFDYVRQDWSGTGMSGAPGGEYILQTGVAQQFRAGFEVTPNRYDVRHWLRTLTYRAGAYHEQSHLTIGGSRVTSTGFTLGVGIPVYRYYNSINLGIDVGQRGTLTNNLIRERYFLFTISFNLHDIWFIPTLYN